MALKIVRFGGDEKSSAVTGNSVVPFNKAARKTRSCPLIMAFIATAGAWRRHAD
jgi:hypothetical protein